MSPDLRIHAGQLPGPRLVRDYCDAAPALAPFFPGFPVDAASVRRNAERVRAQFDETQRRAMAGAITPTSAAAQAKLERIAQGEGFFVTTGQQTGLFTGPLFTIYKTLTAIRLARVCENLLAVPVAPLFWVAADDHDFSEVDHAFVIGTDNALHRLQLEDGGAVQRSMARRILPESVVETVHSLSQLLPDGAAMHWVREAYTPGRSMADAFALLIERIFARHDLLITSSAHPVVKSLAAPLILREIEQSEANEKAVRSQTDALLAAGYHEQVAVRAGAANVLFEDDEGRDRLVRNRDGDWLLARTRRSLSRAEIHEAILREPAAFSPNVLLRPVVSAAVFPTIAYVGGPAEVSYHAQIGCLFEAHGVVMPLVQPRDSLEIVDYKVQKILDKFGLSREDAHQPFDALATKVVRASLPDEVTETMDRLRGQIADGYADLIATTQSLDPTLQGPIERTRHSSHKLLEHIEKKIVAHLRKKNEIALEQLQRVGASLFPNGEPQERVISGISFLARYGDPFIDAIASSLEAPSREPRPNGQA